MERRNKNIRLLAVFIAVVLLVFTWMIIYILGMARSLEQETAQRQESLKQELQKAVAENTKKLNLGMEGLEADIIKISKSTAVEQVLSQNTEAHKELLLEGFEKYAKSNPPLMNVYMGLPDKSMLLYPEFELPSDYDPTARNWYTSAAAHKEISWNGFFLDAATGHAVGNLALPIFRQDILLGVVGMDIEMDQLVEGIGEVRIGQGGYLMVTDKNGLLVIHPDTLQRGMPLSNEELLQLTASKEEGTVQMMIEGRQQLISFARTDHAALCVIGIADNPVPLGVQPLQLMLGGGVGALAVIFMMVISILGILLFQQIKSVKKENGV